MPAQSSAVRCSSCHFLVDFPRFALALQDRNAYKAFWKSSQSNPSCFAAPGIVPFFKSFDPQSGRVARRPLAGLCHTRCDPLPLLGTTSHPSDFSLRAASRYFIAALREIPAKEGNQVDFALKLQEWACRAGDMRPAARPTHPVRSRGLPRQCRPRL